MSETVESGPRRLGAMRSKRRRTDSIALDEDTLHGYLDNFFNHETDPDRYKSFWEKHKKCVMAWWVLDEPLPGGPYKLIDLCLPLEKRLFVRPLLWWCFEAVEPMKHYSRLFNGCTNYKGWGCNTEAEGTYLERVGQLSELENKPNTSPLSGVRTTKLPRYQKIGSRRMPQYVLVGGATWTSWIGGTGWGLLTTCPDTST